MVTAALGGRGYATADLTRAYRRRAGGEWMHSHGNAARTSHETFVDYRYKTRHAGAATRRRAPSAPELAASVRTSRPSRVAVGDPRILADRVMERRATRYERFVKPVVDRVIAGLLLVLVAPMLVVVAVALACSLGRPLMFHQTRVGKNGKPFTILKFRTMRPDRRVASRPFEGPDRRRAHKTVDDPRHTRIGRLVRKLSLDELPQLFNVLRGDMSLVGPRPELLELTYNFAAWQHCRHVVKPGLTGLWQTTLRSDGLLLHECVDLDLLYISRMSPRNDLRILLRTPGALLRTERVV